MTVKWKKRELCFSQKVIEAFDFLVRDYGFSVTSKNSHKYIYEVQYENDDIILCVYHEKVNSYEIGFRFCLKKNRNATWYGLPIILKAIDADVSKFERGFYEAYEADAIEVSIQKLARLVQKYGIKFLSGTPSIFAVVERIKEIEGTRVTDCFGLSPKRRNAEKAWSSGDYERVIRIYETFRDNLTKSEKRRLEYAIKRLNRMKATS